jgi:hypothetical protein
VSGSVLVYEGGPTGLDSTPHVVSNPSAEPDEFGRFLIAPAGDVNGDGFADLAIGAACAPRFGPEDARECGAGRVYLFTGTPNGLGAAPAVQLEGHLGTSGSNEYFGWYAATAIDLEGDGYADLVTHDTSTFYGRLVVFSGGPTLGSPSVREVAGERDAELFRATALGDVRGVGCTDVMSQWWSQSDSTSTVWSYFPCGASALSSPVPSLRVTTPPASTHEWLAAGDVDGDGFDDALLLNQCTQTGDGISQCGPGTVHYYRGSAAGLSASPARSWTGPNPDNGLFGRTAL